MGTGDLQKPAASIFQPNERSIRLLQTAGNLPDSTVPHPEKHITTVRTSNPKINIINYNYWLILYFLYSILFYCSYTL